MLSDTDRARVRRSLARYWSQSFTAIALSKTELRDAVNATDQWIDDNQASYNAALPSTAQTNLTATQKTLLFCAVALARVSILVLRRIFGEVD